VKKLQVRLISPWTNHVETETATFSRDITEAKADALLSEWAPSEELFTFRGRKAWYCCEPQCQFRGLQGGRWPDIKARLGPHEFLYHGHPEEKFRVPHITHFEDLRMNQNLQRRDRAIAIVSNHGGSPLRCHPDIRYRNGLITIPDVDLFGRSSWRTYRRNWYSLAKAPKNYRGELPGDWSGVEKRNLMAEYKVCICLENMNEPGYFTEKFVEAVLAGCIPVYRATPELRETVLAGACWFDPTDPRWPGEKAILEALQANLRDIQKINQIWIEESTYLRATSMNTVFSKLGRSLALD
jgi:hypothetical protein